MTEQGLAFERLHALARKGYRPEIGAEGAGDSIALRHIGRTPDLLLRGDGGIEGLGGRVPRFKRRLEAPTIPARGDSDQVAFLKFLDTIPKASLRDRTRPWRKKYLYVPGVLVALWGVSIAATVLVTNAIEDPTTAVEASLPVQPAAAHPEIRDAQPR